MWTRAAGVFTAGVDGLFNFTNRGEVAIEFFLFMLAELEMDFRERVEDGCVSRRECRGLLGMVQRRRQVIDRLTSRQLAPSRRSWARA